MSKSVWSHSVCLSCDTILVTFKRNKNSQNIQAYFAQHQNEWKCLLKFYPMFMLNTFSKKCALFQNDNSIYIFATHFIFYRTLVCFYAGFCDKIKIIFTSNDDGYVTCLSVTQGILVKVSYFIFNIRSSNLSKVFKIHQNLSFWTILLFSVEDKSFAFEQNTSN